MSYLQHCHASHHEHLRTKYPEIAFMQRIFKKNEHFLKYSREWTPSTGVTENIIFPVHFIFLTFHTVQMKLKIHFHTFFSSNVTSDILWFHQADQKRTFTISFK